MTRKTLAVSVTIALFAAVAAPDGAPKSGYDPAALAEAVAPFIDEQALLVGHADLTRVDVAAAFEKFSTIAGDMPRGLIDEMAKVRDTALSLHNGYALRAEAWAYMRYRDGSEELYDMKKDPKQFKNQAKNPEYADRLNHMRKALNARLKDAQLK